MLVMYIIVTAEALFSSIWGDWAGNTIHNSKDARNNYTDFPLIFVFEKHLQEF
jgi:hypothetical protein